jgi:membrane associated rhomboid family serine protease
MARLPPLFTTACMASAVLVYLLGALGVGLGAQDACLRPSSVLTRFQVYRILLSPFYHSGIIHILFNMFAFYFLGGDFERQVGTLAAAYTTMIIFIPATGALHTATAYLFDALAGTTLRSNCAVGLSGIIFALIVVQLKFVETVSFFGFFTLPANVYPWFLLVALSLLSPGLSFVGHLSGILVGYGLSNAIFSRIIPSDAAFDSFDSRLGLKALPLHCANPDAGVSAWAQSPGLPTTTETSSSTSTLAEWASAAQSWVSGVTSRGSVPAAFAGTGHVLGTPSESRPSGGVPPSSRLLAGSAAPAASPAASSATGLAGISAASSAAGSGSENADDNA